MQLIRLRNARIVETGDRINKITRLEVDVYVGRCKALFAAPLEINGKRYSYEYIASEVMASVAENVLLAKDYELTTIGGACDFMSEFGYECRDGAKVVEKILECANAITQAIPEATLRSVVEAYSDGDPDKLIEAVKDLPFAIVADESVAKIFGLKQERLVVEEFVARRGDLTVYGLIGSANPVAKDLAGLAAMQESSRTYAILKKG